MLEGNNKMAKKDYSEDLLIQAPTAELLEQQLGWQTVFAQDDEDFGPDSLLGRNNDTEVVLCRDMLAALKRLNPGLPPEAYSQALAQVLLDDITKTLIALNEEKYKLLRDGVPVKYRDPAGRLVDKRLRLIDFDRPDNNRYLAVRELWVRGRLWLRRPDVIGYVNGLPLVFIELKRFEVHIDSAYKKNYSDYLDTIPHLFHWNTLVVISNGHDAQYGSLTSTREHFYRWKRLDEDDHEPGKDQPLLPILLRGMLDKVRLLDIVENFVLFDASEGGTHKIVARNHQVLGVNRVIDRLTSDDPTIKAEVKAGQLGVFWHTQGSGKSYSMLFLTEKIHRKISGSYTFVVITDRTELDDQIASTYTNAGRANSKTDQASSGEALRKMLRDQNRRYVFGLIQKYRELVKESYSERDDIIVISDEAHRTQYGRLALNMRKGLPRAKFLGFTGTPLIDAGEKQLTREVFGDYVSIYDFQRAVADGATLPLFYENRGEKLKIVDPKVSERLADHIEAARQAATLDDPWTDEKEEKLYRELARDYPILTSPTRLEKVAQDFVDHFHQRWKVVDTGGGKAMMVCLDKITCVKMHDLVKAKWQEKTAQLESSVAAEEALFAAKGKTLPKLLQQRREQVEWMKATECCVVVSQEQGEVAEFAKWRNFRDESLDITPHREKMVKRNLEKEFKQAENPFRIAIVCAMWLTGFDAPSCSTVYLDKPMRNHTLMQTIARANRVFPGKHSGVIVDYANVFSSLEKALAIYGAGKDGTNPVKDKAQLVAALREAVSAATAFCLAHGVDLAAMEALPQGGMQRLAAVENAIDALIGPDPLRRDFLSHEKFVGTLYRAVKPDPAAIEFSLRISGIAMLAAAIRAKLNPNPPDIATILKEIGELLDDSITGHAIREGGPPAIDLSKINFEALAQRFKESKHKNTDLEALKTAIAAKLEKLVRLNRTRTDFADKFEALIESYNNGSRNIEQLFEELLKISNSLDEEQERHVREHLTEEELVIFDILTRPAPELSSAERDEVKKVAKALLARLNQLLVLNWRQKSAARSTLKLAIEDTLDTLPAAYDRPLFAQKCSALFEHVYESYPERGLSVYGSH
jgi:type I restriction enzyme R subunit